MSELAKRRARTLAETRWRADARERYRTRQGDIQYALHHLREARLTPDATYTHMGRLVNVLDYAEWVLCNITKGWGNRDGGNWRKG